MRIVLIGQAAFAEKVLETLVERREEVVGLYTLPDTPGRANPLKDLAIKLGITVFQPEKMRGPQVFDDYQKLVPDLNILAYVTDILPVRILNYPRFGSICYHPSLLPKHRGGSAINWAIINGDTKTGITILWPDKGIDTGHILLQKEAEIAPDDTVGSLYYNKLFPLGVEAIVESIELIEEGKAPRIPQDESQATYEKLCMEDDARIDWTWPAVQVYNLIRGTNPQPGAATMFRSKRLKIFDSELVPGSVGGSPGTVISITSKGFSVSARGGAILIKRVQIDGEPKIASIDFIERVRLGVGDVLGE
ncbi:MAG: methionyl-tRNA formyltransferase [Chloroflexi bacterium]|nr:methionyl-tRNA formyltransferase [Chloroflexota bacterium]